jgi:hypothetical chaperone protein
MTAFAAIDFGTSNSAIALPRGRSDVELVELEPGHRTMPTAVFYRADEPERHFGRAAIAAYVDGLDGRLMRSMKSVLGSALIEQSTDVGGGRAVKFTDVIAGYLMHLKRMAEAAAGAPLQRVVLGRPVFFVDDDPERDARAQAALEAAARAVGFERGALPVRAHRRRAGPRTPGDARTMCAGGRHRRRHVGLLHRARGPGAPRPPGPPRRHPGQPRRAHRRHRLRPPCGADGHPAAAGLPRAAPGPHRRVPREVPSGIYFDLATWHLINTVYNPARVAEMRGMRAGTTPTPRTTGG